MSQYVQKVLYLTPSPLPRAIPPPTVTTIPSIPFSLTSLLLPLPQQTTSIPPPINLPNRPHQHNPSTEHEVYITASGLAILMSIILIMLLLLIWILVLTIDFLVRYMTGNLGERKRRRCGGGHEEEGLCMHFGGVVLGEEKSGGIGVGEGVASALDWEGVEVVQGAGAGDVGARRRSAE